jgi:hypothetical protein
MIFFTLTGLILALFLPNREKLLIRKKALS